MVPLKITENVISKVLLAILGSWRWGPYIDSDIRRYDIYTCKIDFHIFLILHGS